MVRGFCFWTRGYCDEMPFDAIMPVQAGREAHVYLALLCSMLFQPLHFLLLLPESRMSSSMLIAPSWPPEVVAIAPQ